MPELADVFRRHGALYLQRFGHSLLPSHRRALQDLVACRTEALGGERYRCKACGHEHFVFHSCRNRSCPKCHRHDTQRWLEKRRQELLPVPYFHVIFTLPSQLRPFLRSHQRLLYAILLKAASRSLMSLARDPKFLGAQIGILAVLHTWRRDLGYHTHVHCLVPAGGLSPDGKHWIAAHPRYLVPVRALSILFRARFMKMARRALPQIRFPQEVWHKPWNVHCKPSLPGPTQVLRYLARYVHRVAITNNRILAVDGHTVTFRYQHPEEHCWKTMTLPALTFIARFLQHVLPLGFHKVRFYGFYSPAGRALLPRIRSLIPSDPAAGDSPPEPFPADPQTSSPNPTPRRCPSCRTGLLVLVAILSPSQRAPP